MRFAEHSVGLFADGTRAVADVLRHNAFTLGTAATDIAVMDGDTAAVATYARRAVKEKMPGGRWNPSSRR